METWSILILGTISSRVRRAPQHKRAPEYEPDKNSFAPTHFHCFAFLQVSRYNGAEVKVLFLHTSEVKP